MSLPLVILAAGASRRMGRDKLSLPLAGKPLIAHVVDAALASRAGPVLVVTAPGARRDVLADRPVRFLDNPDADEGMAASLRLGVAAAGDVAGVIVCLGDMPLIRPDHIDGLLDAFTGEVAAVVPVHQGRRGHPVLLGRALFPGIAGLRGDVGARALLQRPDVVERAMDEAVLLDADTPEALERLLSPPPSRGRVGRGGSLSETDA